MVLFLSFSLSMWCLSPSLSCPHWRWDQRPGRDASRHVERLLLRAVPLPPEAAAGPRAMVLHPDVQVFKILFLQKLCLYTSPHLVFILQWLFCPGKKLCSWVTLTSRSHFCQNSKGSAWAVMGT